MNRVVAYTCPFVPPEWLAAHGLTPRRIRPAPAGAGGLLGPREGLCPYARAFVNTVAAARPAAAVFTTACDPMRRAAEFLADRTDIPTFLLNVPATVSDAAEGLYAAELARLGRFLVALGGRAPDRRRLAAALRDADAARRAHVAPQAEEGEVPLALVGGPLTDADRDIFEQVRRFGGRIVLDATVGAELTAPAPADPARAAAEPFAELVRIYFRGIPHAMRRPNTALYEWLDRALPARSVRGVLFYRHLFCDVWHAELARMRDHLPVPVLELDAGADGGESPRRAGRIQAFLEALA